MPANLSLVLDTKVREDSRKHANIKVKCLQSLIAHLFSVHKMMSINLTMLYCVEWFADIVREPKMEFTENDCKIQLLENPNILVCSSYSTFWFQFFYFF